MPEFAAPPVVEVALGVQFRPVFGLRPIELAPLRELWRDDYPVVQEQPPLPASSESTVGEFPGVQFIVGPAFQSRLWFLTRGGSELVQLQHDRLTVNWRQTEDALTYPRYPSVRGLFERRFADLRSFVDDRRLGPIAVTQVEVSYINALGSSAEELGRLDRVLRTWTPATGHHLGEPEQASTKVVFRVPEIGIPPVRMYVAVDPAERPDGDPVLFLTLTVRGAPDEDSGGAALRFMDQAHEHVVRSFGELTPEARHPEWGRQR